MPSEAASASFGKRNHVCTGMEERCVDVRSLSGDDAVVLGPCDVV